jgi:hypothetical protein
MSLGGKQRFQAYCWLKTSAEQFFRFRSTTRGKWAWIPVFYHLLLHLHLSLPLLLYTLPIPLSTAQRVIIIAVNKEEVALYLTFSRFISFEFSQL